jgi:hypothetical protein
MHPRRLYLCEIEPLPQNELKNDLCHMTGLRSGAGLLFLEYVPHCKTPFVQRVSVCCGEEGSTALLRPMGPGADYSAVGDRYHS